MQSVGHNDRAFMSGMRERTAIKSVHALQIWQLINILLSGLITGVFWGTWLGLSRSMSTFKPETFLAIASAMIGNLGTVMAILVPAALLSTLPVLYLQYRRRSHAFYTTLAGFAFFVIALLITLAVEVPLDMEFQTWTVSTLPANWEMLRDRWEWFHVIRSWASVAGLALLIAGALFWRDNGKVRRSIY